MDLARASDEAVARLWCGFLTGYSQSVPTPIFCPFYASLELTWEDSGLLRSCIFHGVLMWPMWNALFIDVEHFCHKSVKLAGIGGFAVRKLNDQSYLTLRDFLSAYFPRKILYMNILQLI